jgi:hypothetical protein
MVHGFWFSVLQLTFDGAMVTLQQLLNITVNGHISYSCQQHVLGTSWQATGEYSQFKPWS